MLGPGSMLPTLIHPSPCNPMKRAPDAAVCEVTKYLEMCPVSNKWSTSCDPIQSATFRHKILSPSFSLPFSTLIHPYIPWSITQTLLLLYSTPSLCAILHGAPFTVSATFKQQLDLRIAAVNSENLEKRGLDAIAEIHRVLDDDQNGSVDSLESEDVSVVCFTDLERGDVTYITCVWDNLNNPMTAVWGSYFLAFKISSMVLLRCTKEPHKS